MTAPIKGNSCYRLNTICNFERISSPDPERSPFSSVAELPCELFSQMENKAHMGLSKSSLDIEAQKFMTYGSEADSSSTVVC